MIEEIKALLMEGFTGREVARRLRVSPMTVRSVSRTCGALPDCKCGLPHGHKGWCQFRLARAPRRQTFLKNILPARNKRITVKGQRQSATHRRNISDALKIPGSDSSRQRRVPLVFGFVEGLTVSLPASRILSQGEFKEIMRRLFWTGPDPFEALCQKEEWEEERKFHLWRNRSTCHAS